MCDKAAGECKWGFCVAAYLKLRYLIDAVSFKYNLDKSKNFTNKVFMNSIVDFFLPSMAL